MYIVHAVPLYPPSSLSSVEPPQVWFDLKLPSHVIEEAWLSSLQLESVVYACQQHMNILSDGTRAGFLIGKGGEFWGVGKMRVAKEGGEKVREKSREERVRGRGSEKWERAMCI